uniref:Retrovirus-related Pol polyprotein from transposon TNT 1-94 n=1 Tax=Cannabis sativa TaxID=3483 RepID=A0A803NGE1_CANSA
MSTQGDNGDNGNGHGVQIDPPAAIRIEQPQAQIPLPNNHLLPLNLRFDRTNYTLWQSLVLAAVRAYNLDGYILGTIPQPPAILAGNIPNPDIQQWIRFDQFLMHWLMNSVTEHMLGHVIHCHTSSEIWTTFAQLFATRSRARLLQLQNLLQTTKKGSLSIEDYILKMIQHADGLAAAGQPLNDDDLVLYILGGLRSEYEAVIVNLTSRSESLSLSEVQFMLQSQEMRIQQHTTDSLHNVQANIANTNTSSTRGSFSNRGSRGGYRGGRSYNSNRGGRGNRPVCQLCGRAGHIATKCYHRFDITFTGAASTSSNNGENPQALLFESNSNTDISTAWYLDNGATHHMTNDAENLTTATDYKGKAKVVVGNGSSLSIHHLGTSSVPTILPNQSLLLQDILHVPNVTKNLLSISKFTKDNNVTIEFDDLSCLIKDKKTSRVLLQGHLNDGLYKLKVSPPTTQETIKKLTVSQPLAYNHTTTSNPIQDKSQIANIWHCRLGHPSPFILNKVLSQVVPHAKCNQLAFCNACQIGKLHQFSFKATKNKTVQPFQLVLTDVWGPSFYPSSNGFRYYVSFMDDFTKFVWIFPMKNKFEVCSIFSQFNTLVERQFHTQIKSVQSDLGKEFEPLYKLYKNLGIVQRNSCPHTHQQQVQNQHPMMTRSKHGIYKPKLYVAQINNEVEPTTIKAALASAKWNAAMQHEITALKNKKTWILIPRTLDMIIVQNKWVYRIKFYPDGTVERLKARLVAKGFQQTVGIDYFETYSPVIKPCTIRIMFTLAATYGCEIQQIDINHAFLNGELQEDVYMAQPQGFVDPNYPDYVCKLQKAIYCLKQAPMAWFETLKNTLLSWGYTNSKSDTSLFFTNTTGSLLLILVYVDDILITGANASQVHRTGNTISLNQQKYICDLLAKTQLLDSKSQPTPMCSSTKIIATTGTPMQNPTQYRSIIGALQYLTMTRPDISFSVNRLSQYMQQPSSKHWVACKRILRYLSGTKDIGLTFRPSTRLDIQGCTDADWAGCHDDRKLTSGYCIFLGGNLISWCSKKQTVVARSSAESEYRALALATSELIWIESILTELSISLPQCPNLWCDNMGAGSLASNPIFHARTKHIEVDLHFVRDRVLSHKPDVRYVESEHQIIDLFNKPLPTSTFHYFLDKLTHGLPQALT